MLEDPDDVLVARCREGDGAAFATLLRRYQRPIYNAALRVLGREEDAGDVTQAVFLKVIERLDQYDARHKFFSWIYRIAVNEALNHLRRRDRDDALDDDAEMAGLESARPDWQASEAQVSRRIQGALNGMKAADRAVIALRHFSDCSYQEIAEIMEVEVKTVKSRLFEARQRLRELLADLRPVT